MQDLLPASVRQRTKQPYGVPRSAGFLANGKLVDSASELLGSEHVRDAGYFAAG